jgi:hypothetical protein
MTIDDSPDADNLPPGALRRAAIRVIRMDRLPIPLTERLTATEKASAALALLRGLS